MVQLLELEVNTITYFRQMFTYRLSNVFNYLKHISLKRSHI